MKNINSLIANIGELLVVIGAGAWITRWEFVPYIFALGTALYVYGRLRSGMRLMASLWLIAAAVLMFFTTTTYVGGGLYITPSMWLIPFVGFVVNEVYFAFKK